jgi:hypothetical protein
MITCYFIYFYIFRINYKQTFCLFWTENQCTCEKLLVDQNNCIQEYVVSDI